MKGSKVQLDRFHQKLAGLRFLDPACGGGNFLVITYRELRRLELEVLKVKVGKQQVTDVEHLVNLNVDRFYGIEIEEFPAQIAKKDKEIDAPVRVIWVDGGGDQSGGGEMTDP